MNQYKLLPILPSHKKNIKEKIKNINIQITELNQLLIEDSADTMEIPTIKKEKKGQYENMVYTDGSCSKNGSKIATGGIGIYLYTSIFCNNLKIGKRIDPVNFVYNKKTYSYPVSNIRTEGYAILYTMILYTHHFLYSSFTSSGSIIQWLNSFSFPPSKMLKEEYKWNELLIQKQPSKKQIHIFTDSKFWIDVYTSWMPNWILKGILLEKKNVDLLLYGYYYYTLLHQNNIDVIFHHVYSHQKGEKMDEHAKRNNEVDVIAVKANTEASTSQFILY